MSISKFFKEAIQYRLAGGHQIDHVVMNVPSLAKDSSGNVNALSLPTGGSVSLTSSPYQKFQALKIKPVGFNYYSLFYEIISGSAGVSTARPLQLAWIQSTGANLVRIMYPCFSTSEYLLRVHPAGTMPSTVTTANLRPTFITALDLAMNSLSSYGLKALVCSFWTQSALPTAFGETNVVAYSSTTSQTSIYCASMIQWFVTRYANHPALGILSLGNEWLTDTAGITNPTVASLGAWFTYMANIARAIKPDLIVSSDITSPTLDITSTRETMDQAIARYRILFSGLDMYCLHIYGDNYNYTGRQANENGQTGNSPYNPFGYEGLPSLCESLQAMAKADSKPLLISECGIPTTNEEDNPSGTYSAFLSDKKKWKFARSMVPYVDGLLFWNVMDSSNAAGIGQATWCIDPAAATSRAPQLLTIASAFNAAKPVAKSIAGGTRALKEVLRPKVSIKSPNRGAGINIRFTSTAAHSSSQGYAWCTWINLNSTLNSAEGIASFTDAGAVSGFRVVANLVANAQGIYADSRYASGSAGNSNGVLQDFNLNEWYHVAYVFNTLNNNGTTVYTCTTWLNGMYYKTTSMTALPVTIPIGTTVYPMCNSGNGVPMKMQDIALFPTMNAQEIWDHMNGGVSTRALLHIRGYEDGTIADISKNAIALTVSGIATNFE